MKKLLDLITYLSLFIYLFGKFNAFRRIIKITKKCINKHSYYYQML